MAEIVDEMGASGNWQKHRLAVALCAAIAFWGDVMWATK